MSDGVLQKIGPLGLERSHIFVPHQVDASVIGNSADCVGEKDERDHGLDKVRVPSTARG